MADKKISELNTANAVYDADDFALVQDGETKQVNASTVKAYVNTGVVTPTGTQTLTNKTLTSPTINGGTGAFTTLSSTGNTTLGDASGDTLTINGTAVSIPNNLNFDSNTLFVDAANNRVGFGTTTPSSPLSVLSAANPAALFQSTSAATAGIEIRDGAATPNRWWLMSGLGSTTDGVFSIYDARQAIPRLVINTAGNVGVGTATPGARLTVLSATNNGIAVNDGTVNTIVYNSSSGTGSIGTTTNHPLALYTNNGVRATIDASGNVGIGASTFPYSAGRHLTVQVGNATAVASSSAISCGGYSAVADSLVSTIESFGARSDGNGTFGGRYGAAYRRADGTAIASGAQIGYYAFGGQWGTDTSYQSAKALYPASIVGVAEGSFTSATAMPTGLSFRTGSAGDLLTTVNMSYGTERLRIPSAGGFLLRQSSNAANTSVSLDTTIQNALMLDSSGRLGIGQTSPSYKLDISCGNSDGLRINSSQDGAIYFAQNGTVTGKIVGTNAGAGELYLLAQRSLSIYTGGVAGSGALAMFGVNGGLNIGYPALNMYAIPTNGIVCSGSVGIGTDSPSDKLDVNSNQIRLRTAKTPASATAAGSAGQICWDTGYIYVCTATNTWKRAALATW